MSKWLDHAIFYEVYPQSFMDSNADGIGDFKGIQSKLSYIKELGCNAIWMNPCFDSSFYDGGYDVRDYYTTAARYGTNEDLRELIEAVHAHGMHILLDLVAGHTSIEHPWFAASCKDAKNEYSDRYIWRNFGGPRNQSYENIAGFISGFSERPAMAAYNCFTSQPCLNYGFAKVTEPWQFSADSKEAEATRLMLQDIMSFWLDLGCDGFRVDMAGSLVKEDYDHKCTIRLWQKIRAFLDERYPDSVLISEWGNPLEALEAGFHMDFLLHFGPSHYMDLFRENPYFSANGTDDLTEFMEYYTNCYEKTKDHGLMCIPSGNHDMVRMRDTLSLEEMKLAFAFLLTMPGCPFIYYGDEIGMQYMHGLVSKEGAYERTGSRTPMQWDHRVNAGFSAAAPSKLYLPVDRSEDRPCVLCQNEDDNSLLKHVQLLTHFRGEHSALNSNASFRFLMDGKGYPLVYERWNEEEDLLVAFNPSKEAVQFQLDSEKILENVLLSHMDASVENEKEIHLPAGSYLVCQLH
ncbi:MAG: alpha-amylase family glycosyl hydrolase [Eubacteriales bacterium]|nr:alpha-amylase family glycosyl hydrolase [Eubacteriales bacterium]